MMTTLASDSHYTNIGANFQAHSSDGSLEDALEQFTALLTGLIAWIQYQMSIARPAADLIIEARLVMQRAYIALGLAIEVLTIVLGVLHWCEDVVRLPSEIWQGVRELPGQVRFYPVGMMGVG